jgi:PncC family amidohydrolase
MNINSRDLDIVKSLHDILTEKGLSVSVAESCTGGLLSHYLTLLPGSSSFFRAGVVTYASSAKEKILGIPRKAISRFGVVSREIAISMAERARTVTGSDLSIATTGNLGPAVLDNKACGLIYIAVSGAFGSECRELRLSGERDENKNSAAVKAIELLIEVITKG